jgi:hypothetical protein
MKLNKTIVRRTIMSTQTKSEYMLLFRGTDWHKGLSPEETQQVIGQFMAWFERLIKQTKAKTGQPLMHEGKIVSGKKGRTVADGPFAESKEAIAGYFLLQVDSLEEAVAIAKECPILEYGATVEVRPVAPDCSVSMSVRQKSTEEELTQASA